MALFRGESGLKLRPLHGTLLQGRLASHGEDSVVRAGVHGWSCFGFGFVFGWESLFVISVVGGFTIIFFKHVQICIRHHFGDGENQPTLAFKGVCLGSLMENEYENEVFRTDPDYYKRVDWLLSCTSVEIALTNIDRILSTATRQEIEKVARAFFGRSRHLQKGGQSHAKDTHDIRLYNLLQCADTCHDFADDDATLERVLDTFPEVVFPKGFDKNMLLNKKRFINFLSERATLVFGDASVPNPLYKANILTQWDIRAALSKNPSMTLDELFASQQSSFAGRIGSLHTAALMPVDIFTITETNHANHKTEVLKLFQVAQVCCTMRRVFGNACSFVVDNSDNQLVLLLCATNFVSKAFYKRFKMEPNETINALSAKLKAAIQTNGHIDVLWHTEIIDANLFDAAATATTLPLRTVATGNVYRKENPVQICLNGIVLAKSGKYVNATLRDVDGASLTRAFTNKETQIYHSKNSIIALIGVSPKSLKPSMQLNQQIASFSDAMKYALKRAGDWGQVEHCARFQSIFVTSDKLAAMYAYYRGVRFMLLEREENQYDEYPTLPEFIRYTFVLRNT